MKNQKDRRELPVSKAGLFPALFHVIISISKNRNSDRERGGNLRFEDDRILQAGTAPADENQEAKLRAESIRSRAGIRMSERFLMKCRTESGSIHSGFFCSC